MTLTSRRSAAGALSANRPRSMGRLSRRAYEQSSEASNVQKLIASARQTWKRRYGFDPAAARLDRSH